MNLCVLMPFNRQHLAPVITHLLETHNLTWIPCYDKPAIRFPERKWITPFLSKRVGCWESLNEFIKSGLILDDHWYQLAADDTIWGRGYWKALRKAWTPDAEVIVSTQVRYDKVLTPSSKSFKLFSCDLSQFCIKGSLLKDEYFDELVWCADSLLAERLGERKAEFACDAVHYYNALRPSQWGYPESAQKKTTNY